MAVNLLGGQGTRISGRAVEEDRKNLGSGLTGGGLGQPMVEHPPPPPLYRETKAYHGPCHVNLEGSSENGFPEETRLLGLMILARQQGQTLGSPTFSPNAE